MLVVDLSGTILGVNTVAHDGTPLNTSDFIGKSVQGEKWFEDIISGNIGAGESYYSDLEEDRWVAGEIFPSYPIRAVVMLFWKGRENFSSYRPCPSWKRSTKTCLASSTLL